MLACMYYACTCMDVGLIMYECARVHHTMCLFRLHNMRSRFAAYHVTERHYERIEGGRRRPRVVHSQREIPLQETADALEMTSLGRIPNRQFIRRVGDVWIGAAANERLEMCWMKEVASCGV